VSYGFPSGEALLRKVHDGLHPSSSWGWHQVLDHCGVSQAEWQAFRLELYNSQQSSVDAFLEYRPEFLKVGKLAMTLALVPNEDESTLLGFAYRGSGCYQYLFSSLNVSFDDLDKNRLSIITFNYDRSIEHYLFKALKYTHNRPDVECAETLSKIPIVHVHGSLGALPWQSQQARAYVPTYTAEDIQSASEKIIVVSEGQETSPEFERAFKLMEKAERIYFLGFGYNRVNLQRLGVHKLPKRPQVIPNRLPFNARGLGTAHGMEDAEMEAVKSRWDIFLPDNTSDCLRFLRKYAQLD